MAMLPLFMVVFVIGSVLATAVSALHFAMGFLTLTIVGFFYADYIGIPVGEAVTGAAVGLVCAQLGYIAGVGASALWVARIKRATREGTATVEASRTTAEGSRNIRNSSPSALGGGEGPH